MLHLITLDIDGLEDMPDGGCGWKAAAGVLASCLSLALQIHKTPCVSKQMQESVRRESVSKFELKRCTLCTVYDGMVLHLIYTQCALFCTQL